MSLVQRERILNTIEKVEAFSTGLSAADTTYIERNLVQSQLNTLIDLQAKFDSIQDTVIGLKSGQEKDDEISYKATTATRCSRIIQELTSLLSYYPKEDPTVDMSPSGTLCHLMKEMIQQNNKFLAKLTLNASTPPPLDSRSIRLPQIELPKFSGKYSEWVPFKDRFRACIANLPNLSKVQKLEYLKSSLSGDAASTIGYLPTTESNFDVAWELLKNRFERKSEIVAEHIRAFYNMPAVSPSDPNALQRITNILSESLLAMDAINVTGRDPWLIQFTLDKLDSESRVLWGRQCGNETPTMREFRAFLNQRCLDATHAATAPTRSNPRPNSSNAKPAKNTKRPVNAFHTTAATSICQCCNQSAHPLYKCPQFLAQNAVERFETVKKLSLCRNCLAPHLTSTCTFRKCKKCQGRHNILLHEKFAGESAATPPAQTTAPAALNPAPTAPQPAPTPGPSSANQPAAYTASVQSQQALYSGPRVFLATAMVDVLTATGEKVSCRAILDSGAQICIMTTHLYQKLKLPKMHSDISVVGIGNQANPVKHKVTVTIFSQRGDDSFSFTCYVLPKISGNIPNWDVDTHAIQPPSHIPLADPEWNIPRPVDLLISGDPYWASWLSNTISLGTGLPHLRETCHGYVIVGEHQPPPQVRYVHHVKALPVLEEVLSKFWEIEELPEEVPITDQQLQAEEHFSQTYQRDEEGRFIVSLPFRIQPDVLGNSRPQAVRQFLALERQFDKKPQYKKLYTEVMNDYMDRKWLEPVPVEELNAPNYYMPHHGVMKESSTTTKLRVVCNASAKSSSGYSLNELLLIGPTVQPELVIILLRFRLYQFAMTADITKMYPQLRIDPPGANRQRVVWRSSKDQPIRDYRFVRVCFGVASSPFLATRALIQLANDYEAEFPLAAKALRSNFYVDDCLVSVKSLEEAQELQRQLIEVLRRGGFSLTKWTSNHKDLRPEETGEIYAGIFSAADYITMALGHTWDSIVDQIKFQAPVDASMEIKSKRSLASAIAQLYDPLGLIGPVVVEAKIMLQTLHELKLGWDEAVPSDIQTQWKSFIKALQDIKRMSIPRWTSIFSHPSRTELHVFCDASTRAYGAAVYIVTSYEGNYHSSLFLSKSRVAPLKRRTIPQLELCAAVLGVETIDKYKEAAEFDAIHYWSDSTVVLHWINSPPDSYKVFVANRIKRIRALTEVPQWRHVSTGENPADLVSRGASPSELKSTDLWWKGPEWLQRPSNSWPAPFNPSGQPVDPEGACFVTTTSDESDDLFDMLLLKHSSLPKIQRIVAYCFRFRSSRQNPQVTPGSAVGADEMERALLCLIRNDQKTALPELYRDLQNNQPLSRKCKSFLKLTPFMDQDELIRCVKCYRAKPKPLDQLMGNLPESRVNYVRPFHSVGIDFAGPIQMLSSATRGAHSRRTGTQKAYIAIFVCMATKAVHLEVVTSLSTEDFIATLRCFTARKGTPRHIYSDCGKNFQGAANEIVRLFNQETAQQEIVNRTQEDGIVWHFNPPASPHHGGLWEAVVKSTKYHLVRATGGLPLTHAELNTILCQIEMVLNSRPICMLSTDPNEESFLTPGHFYLGEPANALPNPDVTHLPENRQSYWQLCQSRSQIFAKKWRHQYLNTLQQRRRWQHLRRNLKEGDVVLLYDDTNRESSKWLLGRIISTTPGTDGLVRVVSVRTKKGTYQRPITKIAVLPIRDNEDAPREVPEEVPEGSH
ncbi:uncharacterized protein LOC129793053 [Lutzomyia longipalpis]|uniref:uncharacterized protein LOC129793053 n=1 Tax=Lutzomyia longipalpis TaxID=7200 RepID=UPI0024833551|nr:uncharacterized protein LOC129793053 [Lutzomyia longipalpis]